MSDVELHVLAARQYNRFSRAQLEELGFSASAITHRLDAGRMVSVEEAVYALPPVLEDDRALWMGVTLTAPESYINRLSAACAWGVLEYRPPFETIVRPGSGGPERFGHIIVYRSKTLAGETTVLEDESSAYEGIPVTTMPRTLLDLACFASDKALARALRESIRLKRSTMRELGDHLGRFRGRRGSRRLAIAIAKYKGLPLERAKSGAEIRALEILRDAERPMPKLNIKVAGEEADLVWAGEKLIIEIDGDPFHQDVGADTRKEAAWRGAGWRVERIPSDDVYERPAVLLAPAPPNVAELSL